MVGNIMNNAHEQNKIFMYLCNVYDGHDVMVMTMCSMNSAYESGVIRPKLTCKLYNFLDNENWHEIFRLNDVDNALEKFLFKFNSLI